MHGVEIELEGLSVHRAIEKLINAGIGVLSARRTAKNALIVCIRANDRKKAFAILRGSCYNIKNTRFTGTARALSRCIAAAGLLIGMICSAAAVLFLQGRVLRVEVTGSGEYLAPEVRAILAEEGVGLFSDFGRAKALLPRFLALPRVHFCTVKGEGGVLTVRLEVSDETQPLAVLPLCSPAEGRVEELIVLGGTPLVQVGDSVARGQVLVSAERGETGEKLVIARARISFPIIREYELPEEQALLQASLEFGELTDIHTTKTATGCRVEGTAYAEAALGFG